MTPERTSYLEGFGWLAKTFGKRPRNPMPTVGSLFSGCGGMDLGLQRAGWEIKFQVEIDDYCRRRILEASQ